MFGACVPGRLFAGTPFGSPNPPVCTSSRGFLKVGIAELPSDAVGVGGGKTLETSGMFGAGVFLFAVAGFTTGAEKTGLIIFGFGGSTTTTGFGSTFATTGCLIFGFGAGGGGGCGFHATMGGASIGVVQYR